jgi:hypothetical protein
MTGRGDEERLVSESILAPITALHNCDGFTIVKTFDLDPIALSSRQPLPATHSIVLNSSPALVTGARLTSVTRKSSSNLGAF